MAETLPNPGRSAGPAQSAGPTVALTVSIIYALSAGALLFLSEELLELALNDETLSVEIERRKNVLFIGATTIVLYALLRFAFARADRNFRIGASLEIEERAAAQSLALLPMVAVVAGLIAAIGVTGWFLYQKQKGAAERWQWKQLEATAASKEREISRWLEERRRNAQALVGQKNFVEKASAWLNTRDEASAAQLREQLVAVDAAYQFHSVQLLDTLGRTRLTSAAPGETVSACDANAIREALTTGTQAFSSVYNRQIVTGQQVSLDLIVPFARTTAGVSEPTAPVGLVCFRIDPELYFFSVVESATRRSPSAETLLVRRDGDEVVYVSRPRFVDNARLSREPMDKERHWLAATVVSGDHPTAKAIDYRGVEVLNVVRSVPKTPWFLIAKADAVEVAAPARRLAIWASGLVAVFVTVSGLISILLWRFRYAQRMALEYRREAGRRLREAHYGLLGKYANDAILLLDNTGRILDANDRAEQLFGFSHDEMTGRSGDYSQIDKALNLQKLCSADDGEILEVKQRAKDGSAHESEASVRIMELDGQTYRQVILRNITERRNAEARIRFLALHDELTGVANRHSFENDFANAVSLAKRAGSLLGLLYIDLDGFKSVNDRMGHQAGDALLKSLCARLSIGLRETDVVGRIGGDEFGIMVLGAKRVEDFARVAQKIISEMSKPVVIEGQPVQVGASVGIGIYPHDGSDPTSLLRAADEAMYRAKSQGSGHYSFASAQYPSGSGASREH